MCGHGIAGADGGDRAHGKAAPHALTHADLGARRDSSRKLGEKIRLRSMLERGEHQGAWNLMKAFLPESNTSVSKLLSVSDTDPAAAVPSTAARPRAAILRIFAGEVPL